MDTDSDFELALKLQQQFDQEFSHSVSAKNKEDIAQNKYSNVKLLDEDDCDEDFKFALRLQQELNGGFGEIAPTIGSSDKLSDSVYELLDPNPDVFALFVDFDRRYFYGKLASVEVLWSKRMTLCAGLCEYHGHRSGVCRIKLSEPLLKFRPRKDLLETLLHEMIHAFLFLTKNDRDRDGHGPEFKKHMHRVNGETGLNITIYHSFHDEVAVCHQHWWQCDGLCKNRKPFFGLVKRAMNRAPSARDPWWAEHLMTCGGTYHKIREPENFGAKKRKSDDQHEHNNNKMMKIDSYFSPVNKTSSTSVPSKEFAKKPSSSPISPNCNKVHMLAALGKPKEETNSSKSWGVGYVLGGSTSERRENKQKDSALAESMDLTQPSSLVESLSDEENLSSILNKNVGSESSREWSKAFQSSLKINTLEEGWRQLKKSTLDVGETIDIPGFISVSNPNHPKALAKNRR